MSEIKQNKANKQTEQQQKNGRTLSLITCLPILYLSIWNRKMINWNEVRATPLSGSQAHTQFIRVNNIDENI